MNNQGLRELPYLVVAAAILQREGRVLLTRRKLGAHQGGLWEFPGGKQEARRDLGAMFAERAERGNGY